VVKDEFTQGEADLPKIAHEGAAMAERDIIIIPLNPKVEELPHIQAKANAAHVSETKISDIVVSDTDNCAVSTVDVIEDNVNIPTPAMMEKHPVDSNNPNPVGPVGPTFHLKMILTSLIHR
jgi:hypothetical protein